MKQSRLFKIVYYLMEAGKSTAPELAEKFEVSIRTIYRDLDVISAAGIPIYASQGKGGGIFIMQDFVLLFLFFSAISTFGKLQTTRKTGTSPEKSAKK